MEEVFKLIPIHLELIFNRKMIFSNKLNKANLHLKTIFIAKYFNKPIQFSPEKPSGDAKRLFSMERANSYGFYPEISIEEGLEDAIKWFILNKDSVDKRVNVLNK